MSPRRWLLIALSLGSLVILSYAGIAVAFSIPVDDAMAAEHTQAEEWPIQGTRAVVTPLGDPGAVETYASEGDAAWLVVAPRAVALPAQAEDPSLVRALAFVSVLHNGSYAKSTVTLTNLTSAEGTFNATLNMSELGTGRPGYLVKTTDGQDIRFVETSRVVGQVARFESNAWTIGLVALGSVGFVVPLVALMLTARPTGRRGLPANVPLTGCPECRRPIPSDASFCMGCGAWVPEKRS